MHWDFDIDAELSTTLPARFMDCGNLAGTGARCQECAQRVTAYMRQR